MHHEKRFKDSDLDVKHKMSLKIRTYGYLFLSYLWNELKPKLLLLILHLYTPNTSESQCTSASVPETMAQTQMIWILHFITERSSHFQLFPLWF